VAKYFPLALIVTVLTGCAQKSTQPEVDPQLMQQFQETFQAALQRGLTANIEEEQVGAVSLRIVTNRQGQALSCKARPAQLKVPPEVFPSNPREFAGFVEAQCLRAIYPSAPDALYDDQGQLEVVAPVTLVFSKQEAARWKLRSAQRRFFREHLLEGQGIDSVGIAVIRYLADAQGHAMGCLVDLGANTTRPADFKLDGALQSRLNSACMQLDLRQVPGFAPDRQQPVEGVVALEYAPWTVER